MMFYDKVKETTQFIQSKSGQKPKLGIILGSGLGSLVNIVENKIEVPYEEIVNFPVSEVEGHAGKLVFGQIDQTEVVLMAGRFHYYEGFTMKEVSYPVYVMKMLGIEKLIITNACGGINPSFEPGDLMIISDFINGVSTNPLHGVNDERLGPRFPDMSDPYTTSFRNLAKEVAKANGIKHKEGVYAYFQGPYYETVQEIKMYGLLGADAIGMSTVPETIVGNYLGLDVLGISVITNMATGLRQSKHSHQEVVDIAHRSSQSLLRWIEAIIKQL